MKNRLTAGGVGGAEGSLMTIVKYSGHVYSYLYCTSLLFQLLITVSHLRVCCAKIIRGKMRGKKIFLGKGGPQKGRPPAFALFAVP